MSRFYGNGKTFKNLTEKNFAIRSNIKNDSDLKKHLVIAYVKEPFKRKIDSLYIVSKDKALQDDFRFKTTMDLIVKSFNKRSNAKAFIDELEGVDLKFSFDTDKKKKKLRLKRRDGEADNNNDK